MPDANPTEKWITKRIMNYLRNVPGSFCRKIHGNPLQSAGLPDILFIHNGKPWFFEVKRPGNTATSLQLHTIGQLREAGAIAHVVMSVEDVQNLLKDQIKPLEEAN